MKYVSIYCNLFLYIQNYNNILTIKLIYPDLQLYLDLLLDIYDLHLYNKIVIFILRFTFIYSDLVLYI